MAVQSMNTCDGTLSTKNDATGATGTPLFSYWKCKIIHSWKVTNDRNESFDVSLTAGR